MIMVTFVCLTSFRQYFSFLWWSSESDSVTMGVAMICWSIIHCWMSPLKIWVGKCLSKSAVDIYEMRILAPVLDPHSLEIKFKWGNDKKEAAVKFLALFLNTKTAFSKPCSTQIQALPSHSKLSNANNWQFGFHTFWHLTTLIQSDLFQIFPFIVEATDVINYLKKGLVSSFYSCLINEC